MGPLSKVAKVEVDVVRFCERIEVGGVEFENIHGVEGSDGSHISGRRLQYRRSVVRLALLFAMRDVVLLKEVVVGRVIRSNGWYGLTAGMV